MCCEIWPLSPKEEVVLRIQWEPQFHHLFWHCRAGVGKCYQVLTTNAEYVRSHTQVGLRIVRRLAFVHAFQVKVGNEPGTASCSAKMVQLPGYNREPTSGVLLEKKGLPDDVEYEEVEAFSTVLRRHGQDLLSQVFRPGQGRDRFQCSVNAMVGKRAMALRGRPGT